MVAGTAKSSGGTANLWSAPACIYTMRAWHRLLPKLACLQRLGIVHALTKAESDRVFTQVSPDQFDLLMHIDKTSALEPLFPGDHFKGAGEAADLPETFPFAV